MPPPRQILPGKTYLITRRCTQRQFLIRPSEQINEIIRFCLAYAAEKHGIQLHAAVFMGNHHHLILTDPEAKLPKFMGWLNEYVAKCVNAVLGRYECLWSSPESYSCVRIEGEDATSLQENTLEKLLYVLTNPVSAGLIRSAHLWPGMWSSPTTVGIPYKVKRPQAFFRPDGPVPESATLAFVAPPCFAHIALENYRKLLIESLKAKEKEIQVQFKAQGRGFMGQQRILAQSPFDSPRTREPRRTLNPRISCRDKWKRIEILQRLKEFLSTYRQAWKRFCEGDYSVVFPAGTYKMRLQYGVACDRPP